MLDRIKRKISKSNDQFLRLYDQLWNFKYFTKRNILEHSILNSTEAGITNEKYCEHNIVVSLTTYSKRLWDVCYTIESLMQQSRKANRIILWIDETIPAEAIPAALKKQEKRGLEILPTKDIKSYKKLIPTLHLAPNDAIITFDDDALYDFDLLDRFISAYLNNQNNVYAARVHQITTKDYHVRPYSEWNWCVEQPNIRNPFFTGVGGVLYPPHSLAPEVMDEELFMKLAPTADDIWFNAMVKKAGFNVVKLKTREPHNGDFISNDDVQDIALTNINVNAKKNNEQFIKVYSHFNLLNKLEY